MKKLIILIGVTISSMIVLFGCVVDEASIEETKKTIIKIREAEVWEKKVIPAEELKVGIITDTQVHASRVNKYRKGSDADRYLKPRYGDAVDAFVIEMETFQPDVVVVPGDIVEGTNDDDFVSVSGLQIIQEKLSVLDVPIIWAVGNHELRSLTKEEYMQALGIDYLNSTFDYGDHRIIVLDGNFYPGDIDVVPGGERYIRGHVAQSGIKYLEKELQTDKQTIVFIHQPPLVGEDITDRSPNGLLDNADVIQDLLVKYNASTAMGGHIEYKRHIEKDGVDYYALPGTIKSPVYPGAYYSVIFTEGKPDVTMFYIDPDEGEYVEVDFETTEDKSGKKVGTKM